MRTYLHQHHNELVSVVPTGVPLPPALCPSLATSLKNTSQSINQGLSIGRRSRIKFQAPHGVINTYACIIIL